MLIGFDGAKIHFFPDIPAVSAEILALRGLGGYGGSGGKYGVSRSLGCPNHDFGLPKLEV